MDFEVSNKRHLKTHPAMKEGNAAMKQNRPDEAERLYGLEGLVCGGLGVWGESLSQRPGDVLFVYFLFRFVFCILRRLR